MSEQISPAPKNVVVAEHEHLDFTTIKGAAYADANEHSETLGQAYRVHKKAIFWSMALSAALIMEGYDVVVIGSFYQHRKRLLDRL